MPTWEEQYKEKGIIQSEPDPFVIEFVKSLKPKSKILDLGCGTGRHLIPLAEMGFEMYGTDISKTGIEICKKQLKEKNLDAELKIEDFAEISFPNEFFDAVISTKTINHAILEKIKKASNEICRVTKKKGKILITVRSTSQVQNKERKGIEIEKNTYVWTEDPVTHEEGVTHHYFGESEIKQLFNKFKKIELKLIAGSYKSTNKNTHFLFIGEKL